MTHVELHLHDHLSLLDGLNTPAEYMERAKELGMTHLAQTNHGTNAGHREFQRAAKEAGIIPILGQEVYFSTTDRFDRRAKAKRQDGTSVYTHLIALARNENGLKNLNRMSQVAWSEGFFNKPRLDMEVLEQCSDDVILLSGCIGGPISKALWSDDGGPTDMDEAIRLGKEFKRIFGDRFFIELQGHNPKVLNEGLIHVAKAIGSKTVVTSDCHYAKEEDLWIEEAMLILSTNPKPGKDIDFNKSRQMDMLERFNYLYPDRMMTFQEYQIFLRSFEQHRELLAKQGIDDEPIRNTMLVAEMIGEYPYHSGLDLLPKPKNVDPDEALRKKCNIGMKRIGKHNDEVYKARLEEELEVITGKGFSQYFLVLEDAINYCHENGIRIGPGRGSGAGSLVNYTLGITGVDPIEHGLLFFRFLNPERNDMPDVDVDIDPKRRSEVKAYLKRKFKHVASIATFGEWGGKASVRDASRVFRVPLGEVNKALKGADWMPPLDWWDEWLSTDRAKEFSRKYPEVIELAQFMEGRINRQGMHAGGVVVSKEPIENYAPIQTAKDASDPSGERIPLIALNMDEAADVGFIKYDLLGINALTIIDETLRSIKEREGIDIDPYNIPLDDANVFASLSSGYTKGIFQADTAAYTRMLIAMGGVANFNELAASNALVRPGAMKSSAGKAFLNRKHGKEKVKYHHAIMEPFTKDTYGVVIYQEQVMLTMTELAGMSMGDADRVRKIIGKKKDVSEFDAYKAKFIEGASKHVTVNQAEGLWKDFEAHAGYSFNLSHAVAYSMISYWTAWLKHHYPVDFIFAILKHEGDKDKVLEFLIEAKRLGIRIRLPHVNASGVGFEIQNDDDGPFIRFGLSNIKFISDTLANRLIDARPFVNYHQLQELVMTKGSGLSTRVLGSLNAVGAAAFNDHPRTGNEKDNYYEYLSIPEFASNTLPPHVVAQFTDLEEYVEDETVFAFGLVRGIKTGPGWARLDIVDATGAVGVFCDPDIDIQDGKQYIFLIGSNRVLTYIPVEEYDESDNPVKKFLERRNLADVPDEMWCVVNFRPRTTKAGKAMADVTLSNNRKELLTAMAWPTQFKTAYVKARPGEVIDVVLKELDGGGHAVDYFL